jgi:uncharacterized protein
MLAIDGAAIRRVRRHTSLRSWFGAMAGAGLSGIALATLLGALFEDHFGIFRLWAYGIFLHGVGLLLATAVLWRRSRPRLAMGVLAAAALVLAVAVDAFWIEPHWLEVSHRQIASAKIRRLVRIVVVADLQTDSIGAYERAVLQQVMEEKPDLILLAGDYVQAFPERRPMLRAELHDLLQEIHLTAPLGVFAVGGNVDPYNWQRMFQGLDITTVNSNQSFNLGQLRLTCLGLRESIDSELHISRGMSEQFHIVLGHVPNFAMGDVDADLMLAGHTHGGQVRIPGIGPVITHARVPHTWAAGLTELPDGGHLLVSRGIGMERGYAPPMRFLCRPELVVIDLVPEEKGNGP